jgi:hypothetical protein
MLYTGIYYIDLVLFYLGGALTVYLILKDKIKKAAPAEEFIYWLLVFSSWASLCLFVVLYLIGFAVGFVKQLRIELKKE